MTARPATADLLPDGRPPLLRLLAMARPLRGRLLLAAVAGAAATGCGVALLAVSGFLLARASQHPAIIAISVAVVAVRALSIGRGVSRYLERLASHDVAFRVLAQVRVAMWRRLEVLAPAGLALFRSGDLLARLVSPPCSPPGCWPPASPCRWPRRPWPARPPGPVPRPAAG